MEAFTTLKAVAVPIDIPNCDTDQIIPARYLRRHKDEPDYASFLFRDLRYDAAGREKDFPLNKPAYKGAKIVVADVNWGCGSSREGAVHVIAANGVRAVIAPSIADIHRSNCTKNGVLPVLLPRETCDRLRQQLRERPGAEIAIDLAAQTVTGPDGTSYRFEIGGFDKHRLLHGLDDIDMTLEHQGEIDAFVAKRRQNAAWVFPG